MKVPRLFLYEVLVFSFVICEINWSWADQADDSSAELEPIIVSASRSEIPSSHVADQVEVFTQEDLQALPAQNLAEALNYMPGVNIFNNGPFGQVTSVSIQGSDSRQVLVMVDGVPFNTQLSGQANLSEIPLEDIQQIDVIKGGASSAWGSSLGSVINVITKSTGTTTQPQGQLTTTFGQFDETKNSLNINGKTGNLSYFSFGSFLNAHGNLADSHTREIKNFTKLNYDFNRDTSLMADFGYSGAKLLYGPTGGVIYSQPYISRYGTLQVNAGQDENKMSAAYKINDQDIAFEMFNSTSRAQIFSTLSHDFYQGVSLKDVYDINSNGVWTTGIDSDWHLIKSSTYLTKPQGLNTDAPYTNLDWRIKEWDIIPGVRYDYNSRFGSQLSPSFGVVYHVPGWHDGLIRAKAARVFNAPALLWIYNSNQAFHVDPNLDLKAERANSYELGTERSLFIKGLKGELDLYRSDVRNAIGTALDNNGFLQQQNYKKFVRQGLEARLDYTMNMQWSIFIAGDFNDVVNEETNRIFRDTGVARQSFKWGTSYQWPCGFKVSLEGYYNRWGTSAGEPNDRKPIFDVHLTQDIDHVMPDVDTEIFFNVYNITNSSYWSSPTFPLPGRYVEGGVSVKF